MSKNTATSTLGPVTLETIHKDLQALNVNLAKQYKMRHIIWTSIVRGLFTGIGATIVLSLLFFLVSSIYSELDNIPIFHDFFQSTKIEQVIQKN